MPRKIAAFLVATVVVISIASLPKSRIDQPLDWLINQWARLRPDGLHRSHIDYPVTACPELNTFKEPIEVRMAYRFPNNEGIAASLADLTGNTIDLYFKGPGKSSTEKAEPQAPWQILLGTNQPNKFKGRAVGISSDEEKAILGLLQRWYRRLPASRTFKHQENDDNLIEIINRLELRN